MNIIYHDLDMDFHDNRTLQTVKVKQFDKIARYIRLHLYDNGKPIKLENISVNKATVFASVGNVATAVDDACFINDEGSIEFPVRMSMTAIAGVEKCEVRIVNQCGIIHTATFNILVEPSPVQTDMPYIISTADFVERLISIANGAGGIAMASAYTNVISESTEATAEVVQPVDIILYAASRDTATSPTVVNFNVAGGISPYVGTVDYKRSDSDEWITTAIITEWDGNSKSISVPTIEATVYDIRITITDSQNTQATCYLSI